MVNDYISIGNGEFVVEIYVNERLEGSPLNKVLQGVPDTVHVLLIKRKTQIFVHPADDFTLSAKDVLVLLGQLNTLKAIRSEEHTSELQSLMRISYAVFCLKTTNSKDKQTQ